MTAGVGIAGGRLAIKFKTTSRSFVLYSAATLIFVFGTVCLDRLRRVPHLPESGGYVEIESETVMLGGEAANTANALHQWGVSVTLAGNATGHSLESDLLRRVLEERGLPLQNLAPGNPETALAAPVCDVYVTPDGDRTMFGSGFGRMGPGLELEAMPYAAGEWFTAEPNMGEPARVAARMAAKNSMKLYLMDYYRQDAEPIPPGSFWQCSTDWVGVRGNVQKNVRWVREWAERYRCFAILSDGPNGFVAGGFPESGDEVPVRHYPPFPAPAVVDTTGAGDTFRAGMLYGLDRKWALADCLRFASAAGCLKCQYLGATSRVPTVLEIQAHIRDNLGVAAQYGAM